MDAWESYVEYHLKVLYKMLFFEPLTFMFSLYLYIYSEIIYIYSIYIYSAIIIVLYIYIHIINDRPSPWSVQLGKVFRAARIYLYPTKKVPVCSLIFVVVVVVDFVAVVVVVIGVLVVIAVIVLALVLVVAVVAAAAGWPLLGLGPW